MQCTQCKRPFEAADRTAAISGSVMGDEYTDAYFLCPVCAVYTVMSWRDNFTGIESESVSGPMPKEEGDERVRLIGECPEPWDKKCRCEAHSSYFGDGLD